MPKTIATTPSWYWPDLVPRAIGIPPFSVVDYLIKRPNRSCPQSTVFVDAQNSFSFQQVNDLINKATGFLNSKRSGQTRLKLGVLLDSSAKSAILLLAAINSNSDIYLMDEFNLSLEYSNLTNLDLVLINGKDNPSQIQPAGGFLKFDELVSFETDIGTQDFKFDRDEFGRAKINLYGSFGLTSHSERSLLAAALSFSTFLEGAMVVGHTSENTWLNLYDLSVWQGINGLLSALINSSTTYFCSDSGVAAEVIAERAPNWILCNFNLGDEIASKMGRKKKNNSYVQQAALLGIDGEFAPDTRRDISNSLGSALTFYGTAETMVMLASHPSWYIDEAVGIAIPNMHIVPADPDTYEPIDTLWELLDQAVISAWSPSLGSPVDESGASHYKDGRFITEQLASSDPNGMLYLLDSEGY